MQKIKGGLFMVLLLYLILAVVFITMFFTSKTAALHLGLAEDAERRGDIPRAEYYYGQTLTYNPYSTGARMSLAKLAINDGDLQSAEAIFKYGIAVSPSNSAFYIELARLYISQDRLRDSVDTLDSASNGFAGVRVGMLRPTVRGYYSVYGSDKAVHFKINAQEDTVYYYTIDGSYPTLGSLIYRYPILITERSMVVSVIAVKDGLPSPMLKEQIENAVN